MHILIGWSEQCLRKKVVDKLSWWKFGMLYLLFHFLGYCGCVLSQHTFGEASCFFRTGVSNVSAWVLKIAVILIWLCQFNSWALLYLENMIYTFSILSFEANEFLWENKFLFSGHQLLNVVTSGFQQAPLSAVYMEQDWHPCSRKFWHYCCLTSTKLFLWSDMNNSNDVFFCALY